VKERYHFVDLGVCGSKILKCTLNNLVGKAWTELIWLRIGSGDRFVNSVKKFRFPCNSEIF
jgi:hypothetical protein